MNMWWPSRRSRKNRCLGTRRVLSAYMDGRLSAEEKAPVVDHLSTCQACREELESLRATVSLLRQLPEVAPAKHFTVAPLKPLPYRRAFAALRLATAAAVVLLVAAIAVDWAGVLEQRSPRDTYFVPASSSCESDADYWLVPGVRNDIIDSANVKATTVNLVVPDGSDNIAASVNSLASDGVLYGSVEPDPDGVPQLVLAESRFAASAQDDVQEFEVVQDTGPFAPSSLDGVSPIEFVIRGQEGDYLNMVPANSDNTVLYAFELEKPVPAECRVLRSVANGTGGALGAGGRDWLRLVEYVLMGLVAVAGGTAAALWVRQRRAKAEEARQNRL